MHSSRYTLIATPKAQDEKCGSVTSYTSFHFKHFRKSIISTLIMFLKTRFHLNFLHGLLHCSSTCHRSSEERSCMTCIIESNRKQFTLKLFSEYLKHFVSSWSYIKNLITRHSYPRSTKFSTLHQNLSCTIIDCISFPRSILSNS
jgi:hypothetical protein